MITYFIIGIVIFTYTTISMLVRGEHTAKDMFGEPAWWVATSICVIFWPVIVLWAIYDAIKELKEEGLVE